MIIHAGISSVNSSEITFCLSCFNFSRAQCCNLIIGKLCDCQVFYSTGITCIC
uniref:Uncharacterized protein n=1 Tax=Arundo donax TaxID=35708 RepID=A0A0A9BXD7_ARUDO